MSRLTFNNGAAPPTPASGKTEVYVDSSDKRLATKDDAGLVRKMLEESATLYRVIKVVEIFQGTTTYTPTSGADALFVECVGGGGSGGGCGTGATNSAAAGGGGGGAYSALWTTTIKNPFTVAVGAGGSAPSAGTNPGNAGGDTTFDSPSICTAKGGAGGGADQVTAPPHMGGGGGAGGASGSGVGDIKTSGAPGGCGICLTAAGDVSGDGGGGLHGGGGGIGVRNTTAGGTAGGNYGGGGSGASIVSGGASQAGGAGGNGIIVIWEFQAIT